MFHLVHFGDTLATGFTLTKGGAVNIGGNLTGTNATFTGAVTAGNLGVGVLTLTPESNPDEGAQTFWQTASSGARNLSIDLYQSLWRGFSYLKTGGSVVGLWDLDINGVGGWTFYTPLHLSQPMTGTSATFNSSITADNFVAKPLGGGAGGGYASLNAGGPVNSGYVGFFKADNTRLGYIGYDNGNIGYTAEVGAHNFSGGPINGQLASLSGNIDGIHTALSLANASAGANADVRLLFNLAGVASGYGLIEVHNGATPSMNYFTGPALTGGHVFTGPVSSQTEPPGTNSTRVATTAFVTAAVAGGVPPGTVVDFAGDNAPAGWLLCQGQSVAVATYTNLFNAIQYKYGGGGANFNLPDLGGRVTAGKELTASRLTTAGAGIDGATVGASGGTQTHALAEAQLANHLHAQAIHAHAMGGHQHRIPDHVHSPTGGWFGLVNAGQLYGYLSGSDGNWIGIDAINNSTAGIPGGPTLTADMETTPNTGNSAAVNTGGAGSGTAHQNTQPTMIMNKIIKT
jgi:microcystin-dependent protein